MTTATAHRPTRHHGADPLPRGTCLGKLDPACASTRHGTYSAYVTFGCRCPHAREAARVYHKRLREHRAAPRFVNPIGTRRRLQALCAIGWRTEDLGKRLDVWQQNTHKLLQTNQQVTVVTANRVKALYNQLSGTPGPSEITRQRAAARGWAPPLAWDNIDDPDEQPNLGDTNRGDGYDEDTVGQAVEGRLTYAQIAVHRPDLIETVRRLAKTLTDIEISHLLRWPGVHDARPSGSTRAINAITKLRLDNGIPAHRRPAVVPHRPHRRKRKAA